MSQELELQVAMPKFGGEDPGNFIDPEQVLENNRRLRNRAKILQKYGIFIRCYIKDRFSIMHPYF